MATSVIPDLIDALVTNLSAAVPSTTEVFDGIGVTSDPGLDYLMIGVDDLNRHGVALGAEAEQEWANANHTSRDETGSIVCAAVSWNGNGNAKAARDSAFGTVAVVENTLRTTPAQGVANVLWTSFGSRVGLSQDQSEAGARAIVVFRIHFRARI